MTNPLLSVRNLQIAFGPRSVIDDLSFEVQAGDCLAVIGPNGCGKTVLLKALLELIPYRGEIRWSREARLGYVPQRVGADRHLPLRARDLIEAKARLRKLPPAQVESVLSVVGLPRELLDTSMALLSGGQFQKVLIAFALLGQPNVLLFDEPTASLDELSGEHIYELVHALQKNKGMTVILVSHELSLVYRYANMVLCLSKGRPCMGPPREILTPQMLQDLYAAPPKYYPHIRDHQE
jgi:zinc transport system ATP-binding protein